MEIISQKPIFETSNAPTLSCHASTIAEHGGVLYAAWFGGSREGADDVGIWLSKKDSGEKSAWAVPVRLSADQNVPHWNPVLFSLGHRLFLYYKKGKKITSWQTFFRILENGAWSNETELVKGDSGGRGPVKNKPVRTKNALILAPASIEEDESAKRSKNKWNAFIDISDDGLAWTARPLIAADANLIQPSIWESESGAHAFMRSDAGAVYRSDSADGGLTWGKAYKTAIPNNNSGLDAVYSEGNLYLAYNPVGENWGARTPLALSKSEDNGANWVKTLNLESSEGEYSYPSMIEAGGFLHVVYTYNRKSVMYAKISM
ncbi:MAG: exo-alpha-sialidase [Oscillospiraceae bacterium]|nr:exo-alpha-sialidase [Oscillospiraceae bacterium]